MFVTACSKGESVANSTTEEKPYIKVEDNSGVYNEVIDMKKQQRVWKIVDNGVWKKEDAKGQTETAHYTFVAAEELYELLTNEKLASFE